MNKSFFYSLDITQDINEKNCNTYTFQKVSHTNNELSKLDRTREATGTHQKSPLLNGFSLSELVVADAFIYNNSFNCYPKRKYNYTVL